METLIASHTVSAEHPGPRLTYLLFSRMESIQQQPQNIPVVPKKRCQRIAIIACARKRPCFEGIEVAQAAGGRDAYIGQLAMKRLFDPVESMEDQDN